MDRGRARNAGRYYRPRGRASGTGNHFDRHHSPGGEIPTNIPFGFMDGVSQGRGRNSQQMTLGSSSRHSNYKPRTGYQYVPKRPLRDGKDGLSHTRGLQQGQEFPEVHGTSLNQSDEGFVASDLVHGDDLSSLMDQSGSGVINLDARTVKIGGAQNEGAEDGSRLHIDISLKVNIACTQADDDSRVVPECSVKDQLGFMDGVSIGRGRNSQRMTVGSSSRHSNDKLRTGYKYVPKTGYKYVPKRPLTDGKDELSHRRGLQQGQEFPEVHGTSLNQFDEGFVASYLVHGDDLSSLMDQSGSGVINLDARTVKIGGAQNEGAEDGSRLHIDILRKVNIACTQAEDDSHVVPACSAKDQPSQEKGLKTTAGYGDSGHSEHSAKIERFDICVTKTGSHFTLKPSLLVKNREKRNETKRSIEGQDGRILKQGMVLLKNYLSLRDQVKIVKACRELGLGPGGFYQPGYRDGGKLHLKMMCLGKNWDPETGTYGDLRPIDDAKPPKIPCEFFQFVEKAIKDSHALIAKTPRQNNVEVILPQMIPNICLVNFYSESGRLGLHQDKDESRESLSAGLPVVSFSIGDTAEFSYGDQKDADKAEKVLLESGDVLLFGGKSRHIFHGVSSILPNSAPNSLLEESNLHKGRLNLTFRKY